MIRKFVLILVLAGAAVIPAPAQSTINFTAAYGERDVMYNNAPLPDGNWVSVGAFLPEFDVIAAGSDLPALLASWNELGGGTIRPVFGQPGRFGETLYNNDASFDNQKIWMWIFKTSNDTVPSPDLANVSAYGLFSSTGANWIFPAHDAPPLFSTASINSSEIDEAAFGQFDPNHLFVTVVPEPSTWLLGSAGLGMLMLFLTRDRVRRRTHAVD